MDEHRHHGSGFFNGFVLGLLVGAGLVFLFGTNKGKRVLQMLLDQVEENTQLSELLEMPEDEEEELMGVAEEEPVVMHHHHEDHENHEHHEHHDDAEESLVQRPVAKVKRFFRGSKKLVS